jgi:Membrane-associated phospholipid phosphatase
METLTHYDRELFYAINHGLSHPLLDPVMWLITSLGLGWVQLLLLLAVSCYLAWRRVGYSVARVVLLPGIVAFVGSGALAQIIKRTVPRLRPSNLPDAIVAPDERIFHNSFPSGHTMTAFALAFWVFLLTYRTRYRWWGYGALLLAGLVGLSRVYRGVHYPSDVLTGAAIGMLWGALVYLTLSRRAVPPAAESPQGSASASPRA